MRHRPEWHLPSPLWDLVLAAGAPPAERFGRPALLRFAGDRFMDRLLAILEKTPASLKDLVARPESKDDERAGWETVESAGLTLYQPVHNRNYLVAASLTCELPGLPDRALDAGAGELVWFALRRCDGAGEQGWDADPAPGAWRPLADPSGVEDWEQRLPLFTSIFQLAGQTRRLHAGLVPVAAHEHYRAGTNGSDPRYAVRCVYQRPQCPLDQPCVSRRSRKFCFAAYLDDDAPQLPLASQRPKPPPDLVTGGGS